MDKLTKRDFEELASVAELRRKATHQETRRANERLVLRTIYDDSPISRAGIARSTGLTRTTVSDVVERLLAETLVEETGVGRSTGGKAPIMLRVAPDARHVIGIDVDVDRIDGAILDLSGAIRRRDSRPVPRGDGDAALALLDEMVSGLVEAAERPLLGIGVGTLGLVDSDAGIVRQAVGLDWRDLELSLRLETLTGLPVVVVNDSQAAVMSEWLFGDHGPLSSMAVVKVGEGIGAGIVIEGRLHQGDRSGAGEIGHMRVRDRGVACRCGSEGCLETVASVRAVVATAAERVAGQPGSALARGPISLAALVDAFQAEDALAVEIVREAAVELGRALGAFISALDMREVVVIGSMTALGDGWADMVRAEASRSTLPRLALGQRIRFGDSGEDEVEVGAAAMLMTAQLGLALAA